jgi:hypothetical protein
MEWWNEDIDESTAIAFLKECQDYTRKTIMAGQPDIKNRRFSHKLPNTEVPFVPLGAVIHSSRTKTIWDALRVIASQACGTHFLVTTHKGKANKEYDLLSTVPCSIFMPMGWESVVQHSAWLSTIAWGIDLRNVGKVRPWHSPIGSEPTPIFVGEENDRTFKYANQGEPDFYWWDNLWRSKFDGNVDKWFDFYYEVPSFGQIKALIILLRVLNALHPLDKRAIVPASCVKNVEPVTPHVPWDLVRHFVFDSPNEKPTMEDFGHQIPTAKSYGDFHKGLADEVFVMDNAKLHTWRTENDDGMLHFLVNGREVDFTGTRRTLRNQFHDDLERLGYDATTDIHFAARMFVAAHGMSPDRLDDTVVAVRKKVKKLQG